MGGWSETTALAMKKIRKISNEILKTCLGPLYSPACESHAGEKHLVYYAMTKTGLVLIL